jgi:hypothetical protein
VRKIDARLPELLLIELLKVERIMSVKCAVRKSVAIAGHTNTVAMATSLRDGVSLE